MKKRLFIFLILIVTSIVGCYFLSDYSDEMINNLAIKSAGIDNEDDYLKYKMFDESGQLDHQGLYYENNDNDSKTHAEQVHITFASNRFITINYFYDENYEDSINPDDCWLNPGSKIYYKKPSCTNDKTSLYYFLGFKAIDIDEDNQSTDTVNVETDGSSIKIPDDYKGTLLSISPIGKYQNRALSFNDYYYDNSNRKKECDGQWFADDEEISGNSYKISPTESAVISYKFDPEKYYFIASNPECVYNWSDLDKGIINFDPDDFSKTNTYSVELRELFVGEYQIDTKALISGKKNIKINEETKNISSSKQSFTYSLKGGEKIKIESEDVELNISEYSPLILVGPEESNNKYTYILTAPNQKSNSFKFDPSNYSFDHGDIAFIYQGKEIKEKTLLADGSKLYFEVRNIEDGYWFPEGEHSIEVKGEETEKLIKAIKIYPHILVTVHLPQPESGGSVDYYLDGNKIKNKSVETYAGSSIKLVFNTWHGWETSNKEYVYVVSEEKEQIVKADGNDIENTIFELSSNQPSLSVKLDDSVPRDMTFEVKYFVNKTEQIAKGKYEEDRLDINGEEITNNITNIDTFNGVTISAYNAIIPSGKAIKIKTILHTTDKTKETDIAYLNGKLPAEYKLEIYHEQDFAISETTYEKIEIKISLVDILVHKSASIKNGKIAVKVTDTRDPYYLSDGDIIEKGRSVSVSIQPAEKYTIIGKNVANNKYSEVMKYSKFVSDINKIISEHEIKQTYYVTFDATDPYGKVKFITNKKTIEGKQPVYIGQEIEMTYEITDEKHIIVYESKGLSSLIDKIKSKEKTTHKFVVDKNMAETIITREKFVKVK